MSVLGAGEAFMLASGEDAAYQISKSLRFNSSDSSYLSRTPSSAGNRKTWTWSGWVKLCKNKGQVLFHSYSAQSDSGAFFIDYLSSGILRVVGWSTGWRNTTQVFRDFSAWQHVVVAVDTTNATANDRIKVYVNGTQITQFSTLNNPSQNAELAINQAATHRIGNYTDGSNNYDYLDGYLAEIHLVDGQALSASSFGEYDDDNNWIPKSFTHGTAKHTGDWIGDTAGTPYGGAVNGSDKAFDGDDSTGSAANTGTAFVFTPSTPITGISKVRIRAVRDSSQSDDDGLQLNGTEIGSNWTAGAAVSEVEITVNNLTSLRWETNSISHWYKVYKIEIYYEGAYHTLVQGGINSFHLDFSDNSSDAALGNDAAGSNNWTVNNLAAIAGLETANQGFDVVTYTGTGSDQAISGLNFQPDFVWIKTRNEAENHFIVDSVRGVTKQLYANLNDQEYTNANRFKSFNSNGFTVGTTDDTNQNNNTFVAWCWKAGGTASSNSDGSQTSSVSANTTYGFSVVTGTQSANNTTNTYGHGLGAEPKMIILKRRNGAEDWYVYHKELGNTSRVQLNSNAAVTTGSGVWGSTTPTSSVFTIQSFNAGDFVAYCWSEVSGFSKFGKYTGLCSSSKTVTTGFKPKFVLIKRIGNASDGETTYGGWGMYQEGQTDKQLMANCTGEEGVRGNCDSGSNTRDIQANVVFNNDGFTVSSCWYEQNDTVEYLYAAFADKPPGEIIDSLIDTPTNYEATGSGNNGGNYCTLNPLDNATTLSNGNLTITGSSSSFKGVRSTIGMSSGKWYMECKVTAYSSSTSSAPGIWNGDDTSLNTGGGSYGNAYLFVTDYASNYRIYVNKGSSNPYSEAGSISAGDIIGIALDLDNGECYVHINGTYLNSGSSVYSTWPADTYYFGGYEYTSGNQLDFNFGQRPFAYTPRTGHKSLCTTNLPEPTIADGSTAFDAKPYTGNGSTQTISGLGFSPDLIWLKSRSDADWHLLMDTVRGNTSALFSNSSQAQDTVDGTSQLITEFTNDGFTVVQDDTNFPGTSHNQNGSTLVAWAWDAGDSNTTISAGSLNSSAYDQSKNWSTLVTTSALHSSYNSGGSTSKTGCFDGNRSTSMYSASGPLTITFDASAFPSSGGPYFVEVETNQRGIKVNGQPSSGYTTNIAPNQATYWANNGSVSALTSIEVDQASNVYGGMCNRIRVNGKILVDTNLTAPNFPSISSTVRANPSAGFSIVSYSSSSNAVTVGHGLNAAPKLIILKDKNNAYDWIVITTLLANTTDYLVLNSSAASANFAADAPTSTTFTPSQSPNSDYIAYCFAPVAGYSAFGSYTGNGAGGYPNADGPFVYLGFRPRFVLIKASSQAENWVIYDAARSTYNVLDDQLYPNASTAETSGANREIDVYSNGFKIRSNSGQVNSNSATYIYACFAEHPFKTARAR